ncbi:MAG: FAD-dependent oxidoreductase [Candidatus Bathyarchaeia archaeon]
MKVGIIGGGLAGLSCAAELARFGIETIIFESDSDVGGLAGYISVQDERFPKTYHHVLATDVVLRNVFSKFDLPIDWKRPKIGIFSDGRLFSFSRPLDILRFSPLSVFDRLRLGFIILSAKDSSDLDNEDIEDWVSRKAGENVYNKFVGPLVTSYFGSCQDVTARYIARRWSFESKGATNRLGEADFPALIDRYVLAIQKNKGQIKRNIKVDSIEVNRKGVIARAGEEFSLDKVVFACPAPEVVRLHPDVPDNVKASLEQVVYRACVCVTFRLKKKISSYYWLNVLDRSVPFIACFEYGNLNPRINGGLMYVVAYVDPDSHLFRSKNSDIISLFLNGLNKIFPNADELMSEVKWSYIFKAKYGSPIYRIGYPKLKHKVSEGVYIAGVYMAYPEIRSSGPAIQSGIECSKEILQDIGA